MNRILAVSLFVLMAQAGLCEEKVATTLDVDKLLEIYNQDNDKPLSKDELEDQLRKLGEVRDVFKVPKDWVKNSLEYHGKILTGDDKEGYELNRGKLATNFDSFGGIPSPQFSADKNTMFLVRVVKGETSLLYSLEPYKLKEGKYYKVDVEARYPCRFATHISWDSHGRIWVYSGDVGVFIYSDVLGEIRKEPYDKSNPKHVPPASILRFRPKYFGK